MTMPRRGGDPVPPGQKLPKGVVGRLLKYLKGYRGRVALVVVSIAVSALASVAGSLFLQTLIDDYITPLLGVSNPVFTGLLQAIGAMAIIYGAGVVSNLIFNRAMVTVSQGVQKTIRDEMFAHMQRLPIRYFDANTHGDLMSRYTNDIDTLRQMLSQSLPQMLNSAITIVMVFCAMVYLSLPLTAFVLATAAAIVLVSRSVAGKSGSYFMRQQASLGKVNGYIEEMLGGQKVVKVFCYEDRAVARFDEMNADLCDSATQANKFANVLGPISNNLGHLQYVLLAIAGGAMAIFGLGGLTLGAIASFLQLSRSFNNPISQITQQFNSVVMALAGAQRIFALMDEKPEADEGYVTLVNAEESGGQLAETAERTGLWAWKHPHSDGTLTYTPQTGHVEFFDVDFAYADKPVLKNITLFAEPGQKVALVGATGAGKTTITNLLTRFYDIADGKVRYDDININKIKKGDLRRSLGLVLQDTHLFTGTIMENIRYGRLEATDEEVYAAAKLANADGFIRMMPDGYDAVISGDGAELSQGQRQLLSIARAAVADPPVMILDEATSSIDTRTEAIVQKGMDALMHGRTVFVIAHRLSTVRNADVIMVMENGEIIERGSHDRLIAEKGKYYQLYTGAFELE